jgi:predicted AAA+ superfamily ATPase
MTTYNDDTKQNIWQQIIKEASTQKEMEESHVFIFGDKNTGKRSLIKAINKELYLNYENEERNLPTIDETNSKYSLVEFKYLNVKKTNDSENGTLFFNKKK